MPLKSIRQSFAPNQEQLKSMEIFKDMVNHCIRIGLEHNCSTMKRLSKLSYHELKKYPIQSYYKLTAISQAAGRLAQMKKDIKKGRKVKSPFVSKPYLVSCYGFKINGCLLSFPISNKQFANILLNEHTAKVLSDDSLEPRSFTITPTSLAITVKKQVQEIKPESVIGIDRNLRNITISTQTGCIMYKTNCYPSRKTRSMSRHHLDETTEGSKTDFLQRSEAGRQGVSTNTCTKSQNTL